VQQRSLSKRDTKTVSLNVRYEILSEHALKNTVIRIEMPSSLAEIQQFWGEPTIFIILDKNFIKYDSFLVFYLI
jgi:hypothetical protein